jgi:SAM-dependent methyltransferase
MSPAWFDRLATLQEGYVYPWRSHLGPRHGEDIYRELVYQHLRSNHDVLDVACAQGDMVLDLAPHCHSVLGYDRVAAWIAIAEKTARLHNVTNVTFVCHDSSPEANGGRAHLPASDNAFDLLICSKGPFHWIDDARRVARPGAVLLMLIPDTSPLTPWTTQLPEPLRWEALPVHWARPAIEQRLRATQLTLHSWWSFDVPEYFPNAHELYVWRTWGCTPDEVPSFEQVANDLEGIFRNYAGPCGLEIRRQRYIWKALIPHSRADSAAAA